MNSRRVTKELQDITNHPPANCSATAGDDIMNWVATITGPKDTPYEDGVFILTVEFTKEYPFKPPIIKFGTRVFHPNIDKNGNICLDILKEQWSPALTMDKVLLSICSLLTDPNADDPLDPESANMYKFNRTEFDSTAKKFTLQYAHM